jgi:hypothetical protein
MGSSLVGPDARRPPSTGPLCPNRGITVYSSLHGADLTHRDNLNEAGVQGTSVLTRGFTLSKSQALLHEFINGPSSVTLQENVYFVPRDDNPHKEMESVAKVDCV